MGRYILIDTETNTIDKEYIPLKPKGVQGRILEALVRIEAGLDAALKEPHALVSSPAPPHEFTVEYTIGTGIAQICPACGQYVEMASSEKVDEKRPTMVALPCCGEKMKIKYKEKE